MRLSDGNVSRTMRTLNEYMYDSANCSPSLWHEQTQWLVEMVGHKVAGGEVSGGVTRENNLQTRGWEKGFH